MRDYIILFLVFLYDNSHLIIPIHSFDIKIKILRVLLVLTLLVFYSAKYFFDNERARYIYNVTTIQFDGVFFTVIPFQEDAVMFAKP